MREAFKRLAGGALPTTAKVLEHLASPGRQLDDALPPIATFRKDGHVSIGLHRLQSAGDVPAIEVQPPAQPPRSPRPLQFLEDAALGGTSLPVLVGGVDIPQTLGVEEIEAEELLNAGV